MIMELKVRGSEYSSFLTCRKQWLYAWYEGIEPKRPDGKLFFGTLFHKFLEFYYEKGCDMTSAVANTNIWFHAQDLSDMPQEDIDNLKALFKGVSEYYHSVYYSSDRGFKILGTEVEFLVKLDGDIFMTGTIDLVYETPEGKIRFMDHKTVTSLSMYEEKSKMDRQISRYWWALKMIAAGVGRIKKVIDGKEMWVQWLDIEGKEIDGFDYNLIAKDYPKEPKVLKSGKLSTDKSQKTTIEMYRAKLEELGLDKTDYAEILHILGNKPNQWLQRINVLRTEQELESAAYEFMYTAGDIHDIRLMIGSNPDALEPLTYRNIGTHCQNMCSYTSLCKTTIEGGNVSLVRNLGYKKRGDM